MKVVALAGGVGGAKLADGLAQVLQPQDLTVVVNTGDDFVHLGLYICPDLDTVCYTLAGIANSETGWGRADETWNALETLKALGGPDWFRLGDRDIGLHLARTVRLNTGEPLSRIVQDFCEKLGIKATVLPMTDDRVPTLVYTEEGELSFQEYFVHRQCLPKVTGFRFMDVEGAKPTLGFVSALQEADLVIVCPSNPWVSVDPILSLPGIREEIQKRRVVAVSPIIGGRALKGPAAKMYIELGMEPSAFTVAEHYQDFLTGFILDNLDVDQAGKITNLGVLPFVTDTIMNTPHDRKRLAEEVLDFGTRLENRPNKKEEGA